MINKVIYIVGGLFLVTSLLVAVGLAVWGVSLNSRLAQAQADYQALKKDNDNLKSDYAKLNSDYNKSNIETTRKQVDLAATQAQIADLQDQLNKAQAENSSLNKRITAIQTKASILYAAEFGSLAAIDAKVNGSEDDQLKKLWLAAKTTRSHQDNLNFWDYLVQSLATATGLGLVPFPVDMGALILPIA